MKLVLGAFALAAAIVAPLAAAASDFPVAVEHAFGTTTIPAQPKRVVSIGYVEQDFLYALGVAPVGVRNWWGDHPYATWPWAEAQREALKATPEVMPGSELNYEWILKQNPDLIVSIYNDIDQAAYDALSKIAPTIAIPKGYPTWGAPWQEELREIDKATSGTTAKSEKIIADIDTKFAAVKAAHPEFAGKSGTNLYYDDGNFHFYGPEDTASRFLINLGLVIPPELLGKADDYNSINVSAENLKLLDFDVAIWSIDTGSTTQATVEAMPVYRNMRLSKEGRSVWLDDGTGTLYGAMSFQSPLSITYLLDKLPPMISAALDGDPSTVVPAK